MSQMEVNSDLVDAEDDDNFSKKSTDNSSDDDDADEEKIVQLQKQIDANPYTYELHVELITLCKKLCDLDNLRAARERMNELYPLTPDLWLDWLQDEKNVADQISDKEEKEKQNENLTSLFERALKDYPSVKIWLDYVTFSIGKIGGTWKEEGLENTRQTFERALTSVGMHVTEGYMIWEAYREFETTYILHIMNQDSIDEDTKRKQSDRMFDIYKRQLSVPLVDMDQTYAQFKEMLEGEPVPPCMNYSYKKALQKLDKLQNYEEALCKGDIEQYEAYKSYIEYEKAEGDPSRVQNIYERALIDHYLKDELWLEYTKYIDQVIKIKDISLLAHERATRNCPWIASLWVSYGRAYERYEELHEKTIEMFETAIKKGFVKEEDFKELWFAYLDYLKRRIDKQKSESQEEIDFKEITDVFGRANLQMESYFWGSECEYAIMKYCTFFNAKYKKDMGSSRTLWRDVIDHGHKTEANVWLDFANFERLYGDGAHYRKILLQALSCASDYNEMFVDLLITFEREEGTLETLEKSIAKCTTQMHLINQKRQKPWRPFVRGAQGDRPAPPTRRPCTSSPENDGKRRQSSKRPPRIPSASAEVAEVESEETSRLADESVEIIEDVTVPARSDSPIMDSTATLRRKSDKKKKKRKLPDPEITLIVPPPKKAKSPELVTLEDDGEFTPYDYSTSDCSQFSGKKSTKEKSSDGSRQSNNQDEPKLDPMYPDVHFKDLPSFDVLGTLLKTSLITLPNERINEKEFNFIFKPQQVTELQNNPDVSVQLRMGFLDTSCDQEDNFPTMICLKVNHQDQNLHHSFSPISHFIKKHPNPGHKEGPGPKDPVDITHVCNKNDSEPNIVTISWSSPLGKPYVLGIFLVKKNPVEVEVIDLDSDSDTEDPSTSLVNSTILIQKLQDNGVLDPAHTTATIKAKLFPDRDSEIATMSPRFSLICPLGKIKMMLPSRVRSCTHIQCFDATLYIQMNEKKPKWRCPVCYKSAPYKNLVIDGLFQTIITQVSPDCTEVQFHEDGSWAEVPHKVVEAVLARPNNPVEVEVIDSADSRPPPKKRCLHAHLTLQKNFSIPRT